MLPATVCVCSACHVPCILLAYVHLCLGMHLLWTSRGFVCIFRQVCVRQGHMACRMSWQMTAAVDVRTCKVVFLCNRKRQMNMEKQNKHRQLSLHVCYLSCWSRPDRIAPHSHSHTHTHTPHTHLSKSACCFYKPDCEKCFV